MGITFPSVSSPRVRTDQSQSTETGTSKAAQAPAEQAKVGSGWRLSGAATTNAAATTAAPPPALTQAQSQQAADVSRITNQMRALSTPYNGPTDPASLAKEFVARSEGKIGTDHEFINLTLQLAHAQGQTGELNRAVRDELSKDPSNYKILKDLNGPNGALNYVLNDELSGVKLKHALDCLNEGRINQATDGKFASFVDGSDDALTGVVNSVKEHPFAAAGAVAAGVGLVIAAPVVATVGGAALAIGAAGAAAWKLGSAAVDLAKAQTDEQKNQAFHDLGAGTVDAAMAAAGGLGAVKSVKALSSARAAASTLAAEVENSAAAGKSVATSVPKTAEPLPLKATPNQATVTTAPPPPAGAQVRTATAPQPTSAPTQPVPQPAPQPVPQPATAQPAAQVRTSAAPQPTAPQGQAAATTAAAATKSPALTQYEALTHQQSQQALELARRAPPNVSVEAYAEQLTQAEQGLKNTLNWVDDVLGRVKSVQSQLTPEQAAQARTQLNGMKEAASQARSVVTQRLETLRSVTRPATSSVADAKVAASLNTATSQLEKATLSAHTARQHAFPSNPAQFEKQINTLEQSYRELLDAKKAFQAAGGKPGNGDPRAVSTRASEALQTLQSHIGTQMSRVAKEAASGMTAEAGEALNAAQGFANKSATELAAVETALKSALSKAKGFDLEARLPQVQTPELASERAMALQRLTREKDGLVAKLDQALEQVSKRQGELSSQRERLEAAQQQFGRSVGSAVEQSNKVVELKQSLGADFANRFATMKKSGLDTGVRAEVDRYHNSIADNRLEKLQSGIQGARTRLEKEYAQLKTWLDSKNTESLPGEVREFLGAKRAELDRAYQAASNDVRRAEIDHGLEARAPWYQLAEAPKPPLNESQALQLLRSMPADAQRHLLQRLRPAQGRVSFGLTPQDLMNARERGLI